MKQRHICPPHRGEYHRDDQQERHNRDEDEGKLPPLHKANSVAEQEGGDVLEEETNLLANAALDLLHITANNPRG